MITGILAVLWIVLAMSIPGIRQFVADNTPTVGIVGGLLALLGLELEKTYKKSSK